MRPMNAWSKPFVLALLVLGCWLTPTLAAEPVGYQAAQQMAQQGKWGELLQAAQTAHKQSPNDARWQLLLGVAQAQTQQLGQARATFENMTKRYPELPEAHNNLGLVLAALGQSAEAKQAFEQALRANPGFELAKKNLTWLSPTPARANP
ncbi:MAG: hypothetical protein RL019_1070 [Pseudomonadota bacterium]